MELITKLGVNLNVLLGQILVFVILFFLLQRYVFGPVLNLLEKRRKMIEKTAEDSQNAEKLLADIEKTRMEAIEKIKVQSVEMLEKASHQAEAVKQEILQTGKKQVELIFSQMKLQIEQEKRKMMKEVEQEVARMIVIGASRILEREFSESDQKRLMQEAAEQLTQH